MVEHRVEFWEVEIVNRWPTLDLHSKALWKHLDHPHFFKVVRNYMFEILDKFSIAKIVFKVVTTHPPPPPSKRAANFQRVLRGCISLILALRNPHNFRENLYRLQACQLHVILHALRTTPDPSCPCDKDITFELLNSFISYSASLLEFLRIDCIFWWL